MSYPTECRIGGMTLSPPWTNASGFLATPPAQKRFSGYRTGGVVGKTILMTEGSGHESPVFVEGVDGFFYNAIGLAGPGVDKYAGELEGYYPLRVPLMVSVASKKSAEESAEVVQRLRGLYDAIELNVSCPNVAAGMLAGQNPKLTRAYTKAAKAAASPKPVIVKLTPNVDDIKLIVRATADAGVDAILIINTILGQYINPHTGEPHLTNKTGGKSGHKIIEEGLHRVGEVFEVRDKHDYKFKIGGVGGIRNSHDAKRYFGVGADYIQFGTHLFLDRPMEKKREGVETVQEFLARMEREIYESAA